MVEQQARLQFMRCLHLTNYLLYSYYYKFKQERNNVKALVESNNISEAVDKLNSVITENDNYVTNNQVPLDTDNIGKFDNFSLRHAKFHLQYSITINGDIFVLPLNETNKQAAIDALDESYLS